MHVQTLNYFNSWSLNCKFQKLIISLISIKEQTKIMWNFSKWKKQSWNYTKRSINLLHKRIFQIPRDHNQIKERSGGAASREEAKKLEESKIQKKTHREDERWGYKLVMYFDNYEKQISTRNTMNLSILASFVLRFLFFLTKFYYFND